MKQYFRAHTFRADTDNMRCIAAIGMTVDVYTRNFCHFLNKMLSQGIHPVDFFLKTSINTFRCYAKSCDCRNIFRAGTHSPLLSASV